MEQKNNKYYSYISEYYAANPTKFEKRKNAKFYARTLVLT